MKTLSPLLPALLAGLFLTACNDKPSGLATQDRNMAAHSHTDSNAHGHDHDAATGDHMPKLERLSNFSASTELYLERPPFFVGQTAELTAYLTRLADFKPLRQGRVSVILSGNGATQRYDSDAPATPGIFKVIVTPKTAGDFEMTLLVETATISSRHALGSVPVFADAKAAAAAHQHHSHGIHDEGILFTKEQQWKADFATAEAIDGHARSSISATATIKARPDGEALLVAPATGVLRPTGSLARIGQSVRKGQILAYLAPRLAGDTDQATLQAATAKAGIALEQARRERERMEALFQDEAIAEKRLLEARDHERLAATELQAARARQGQLGGNDGNGDSGIAIRTPIDSSIADVAVAAGAFVTEGSPLFHLADTARLWLEARVPESEIGRMGLGAADALDGAAFTVDGYDQPFVIEPGKNGKLIAVGGVVDAATRTVPAIFEFSNPGNLRLGMTARAQLYIGAGKGAQEAEEARNALLVPASAVQDENGMPVVYVQTGGERFERRPVRVGARDGAHVAILDGLEAGRQVRVVSRGAHLIRLASSMSAAVGHAH